MLYSVMIQVPTATACAPDNSKALARFDDAVVSIIGGSQCEADCRPAQALNQRAIGYRVLGVGLRYLVARAR